MTSMKNVQFLHPHPSPLFLSVRMSLNYPAPPSPGHQNLGYQPPPYPHSLWYSCSISIVFSRSFHQIPCNSQLFTKKLKQTCLTWNAKNKTKMLSKAEPKTCLEHLQQNQTPVWNTYSGTRHLSRTLDSNNSYINYSSGHPISEDPLPLSPPVTIHFRLNFDHFLPTPPLLPQSTGCHKCMAP